MRRRRDSGAFRDLARSKFATRDFKLAGNEKGGVVRRPFSKLQAWLIAVSPQPGVAVAIGSNPVGLECEEREQSGIAAKLPLSLFPASSSDEELLLHPSVISPELPPHRRPL